MIFNEKQKGFGLIELLVVVAIIGLLSSLVVFVIGAYRGRARDARRLSDITQLRQGLEVYYSHASGYPDASNWTPGRIISCADAKLIAIPRDPAALLLYSYKSSGKKSKGCGNETVWSNYKLEFQTETDGILGSPGIYCLRPFQGITPGNCPQ